MGFSNDDSAGGLDEVDFSSGIPDFDFNRLDDIGFHTDLNDFNFSNTSFISSPGIDEVGNTGPIDLNDFAFNDVSFGNVEIKAAPAVTRPQQPSPPQPSMRKRKTFNSKSPCKKPRLDHIGPIEAMWTPVFRESESRAQELPSLKTPQPSPRQHRSPGQHLFTATTPPGSCPSNPIDIDTLPISASGLGELLDQNPDLVYGTPHHNATPALPSSASAQFVNMTLRFTPSKKAAKRTPRPKPAIAPVAKVTKKTKVTPKKVQAPPTPADSPEGPRSINDLLSAPFITLNAQEKLRVLLPLLRGMDPRLLEKNLSELPTIKAKGPGHEKHVAAAITNSPNNEEADDILASVLTGIDRNTPPQHVRNTPPQQVMCGERVSVRETSPLAYKSAGSEGDGQLGATRQLEALKKAAVLKALGKTR